MSKLPYILGGVAIVTGVLAWAPLRSRPLAPSLAVVAMASAEVKAAADLDAIEVIQFDAKTGAERRFKIARDRSQPNAPWTIPSKFSYPADENPKATELAMNLLRTSSGRAIKTAPEALGPQFSLLDPAQVTAGATPDQYGKRVTITGNGGAVVLDLIVGRQVDTADGLHFVRKAGTNQVFTANIDANFSTRFTDYVKTDPFAIARDDVRAITVADYEVTEQGIHPKARTAFNRTSSTAAWTTAQAPKDRQVKNATLDTILNQLASLRLTDVQELSAKTLSTSGIIIRPADPSYAAADPARFVLDGAKAMAFGASGRLDVTTRDGLVYQFLFGSPAVVDDGSNSTSGGDTSAEKSSEKARWLAVYVRHDSSRDEMPAVAATAPLAVRLKAGAERASRSQARFDRYVFVISESAFNGLKPAVDSLFEEQLVTTPSGLKWRKDKATNLNGRKPTLADTVKVKYRGTLEADGTEFDQGETSFAVTGVIKGWTEGLQLMQEGDSFTFIIPSNLAYGEAGQLPKIPANATLRFSVDLLEVIPAVAPASASTAVSATSAVAAVPAH